MKKLEGTPQCPACSQPMAPRVFVCDPCGVRVEGPYAGNEFAALPSDLLHFLRIFVLCEGRIKDMEAALGVSYPTVKAGLTRLKAALDRSLATEAPLPGVGGRDPEPEGAEDGPAGVIDALGRGDLSVDEALEAIKRIKRTKGVKSTGAAGADRAATGVPGAKADQRGKS